MRFGLPDKILQAILNELNKHEDIKKEKMMKNIEQEGIIIYPPPDERVDCRQSGTA